MNDAAVNDAAVNDADVPWLNDDLDDESVYFPCRGSGPRLRGESERGESERREGDTTGRLRSTGVYPLP